MMNVDKRVQAQLNWLIQIKNIKRLGGIILGFVATEKRPKFYKYGRN